jgi:arsenate reductase-like glutaredoxin family protein
MQPPINKENLKALIKEVLFEALEERRGEFYELLTEVFEDIALSRAIQEGEATDSVDRQEIMQIIAGTS